MIWEKGDGNVREKARTIGLVSMKAVRSSSGRVSRRDFTEVFTTMLLIVCPGGGLIGFAMLGGISFGAALRVTSPRLVVGFSGGRVTRQVVFLAAGLEKG